MNKAEWTEDSQEPMKKGPREGNIGEENQPRRTEKGKTQPGVKGGERRPDESKHYGNSRWDQQEENKEEVTIAAGIIPEKNIETNGFEMVCRQSTIGNDNFL